MKYNRKFLFGLLILGLLSACTQTPEQRAKDATVLIITESTEIGTGSGFFVQPDKIVTNIHVVDNAKIVSNDHRIAGSLMFIGFPATSNEGVKLDALAFSLRNDALSDPHV